MTMIFCSAEDVVREKELKIFKDPSFETALNLNPSDRYGYTLQYMTPKVTRASWPSQMQKIVDYSQNNNLDIFEMEQGYVVASTVYMTTGLKAKRNYNNIPFQPTVWAELSNPENLQQIEDAIQQFNRRADDKLKEAPPGAKLDLMERIAILPTNDPRVQVEVHLDRFDNNTFGVKTDLDPTRLTLLYKFDKEHIASLGLEDDNYTKAIHQFSRVTFPALKFFEWQKMQGAKFMEIINTAQRKRSAAAAEEVFTKKAKLN